MQMRRIAATVAVVAAAGLGGWFFLGHRAARSDAAPLPAAQAPSGQIPVTATTATAQDMPIYVQGLGTVQAINTVNVKTRVDGQIMQVFFTEGQEVKQGDTLFLIDPRPYQAALDQALANDERRGPAAWRPARPGTLRQTGRQRLPVAPELRGPAGHRRAVAGLDAGRPGGDRARQSSTSALPISARRSTAAPARGWSISATSCRRAAGTPLVTITQIKPIYRQASPCRRPTRMRSARTRRTHQLTVIAYRPRRQDVLGQGQR